MSDTTIELGLILRNTQKAANAAEAALASARLLESETGQRLSAIEARMVAVEGRLTVITAGQNSLDRAVLRIADMLVDHGGRLDRIDGRLDAIEATLATLPTMESQQRIERALADLAARLP
jgi:hypothetical protein